MLRKGVYQKRMNAHMHILHSFYKSSRKNKHEYLRFFKSIMLL